MLKGIPNILPPDLLKTLHEMGHGDEIVIGDGNFPAANYANHIIRCDGHNVPDLLEAILELFPLDTFVEKPVTLMQVMNEQKEPTPEIWQIYKDVLSKHQVAESQIGYDERFEFYERSKRAYAIVATTEKALYANIILKKGVIS